jgi:hypothetical protein
MFRRKPDILIPNLYFYEIKIQINIKQNLVEKYTEELQFQNIFFLIFSFFFFFWAKPSYLGITGPELAHL